MWRPYVGIQPAGRTVRSRDQSDNPSNDPTALLNRPLERRAGRPRRARGGVRAVTSPRLLASVGHSRGAVRAQWRYPISPPSRTTKYGIRKSVLHLTVRSVA